MDMTKAVSEPCASISSRSMGKLMALMTSAKETVGKFTIRVTSLRLEQSQHSLDLVVLLEWSMTNESARNDGWRGLAQRDSDVFKYAASSRSVFDGRLMLLHCPNE